MRRQKMRERDDKTKVVEYELARRLATPLKYAAPAPGGRCHSAPASGMASLPALLLLAEL
ncbi:hypothetical protein ABZP36_035605 [Zizania latifolia]